MALTDNDALEVAHGELLYRREKQWYIFAWTSTLLVAVIGGAITLAGKVCSPGKADVAYSTIQYILMALAVVVLSSYAWIWINENMRLEELARAKVIRLLEAHGMGVVLPDPRKLPLGYVGVVVLLTIGAVLAIAAPLLPNACSTLSASLRGID
jgi:drug/metabolite transporter (DMT)-like permease